VPFRENNFEIKEERLHFLVMKESTRDKGVLKCALQYGRMPRRKVCLSRDATSPRYPKKLEGNVKYSEQVSVILPPREKSGMFLKVV
jgi:hypothetical protein